MVVNGGFRKSWMAELWIVPAGAWPPAPTPTIKKEDIRYRRSKVTANEFYLRASGFYREACWPMPVDEPRMLTSYKKMRETYDKAWKMTRAPFERVQINYEGKVLDGYFRKPNGPAGKKFPVVIPFQGADTMAEATIMGGGAYVAH